MDGLPSTSVGSFLDLAIVIHVNNNVHIVTVFYTIFIRMVFLVIVTYLLHIFRFCFRVYYNKYITLLLLFHNYMPPGHALTVLPFTYVQFIQPSYVYVWALGFRLIFIY